MKLSDFRGIFKKSTARVESIENPYGDYYQIKLRPQPGTKWNPGEHAFFKLIGKNVEGKKSRAFSLASIPEENVIVIGTRTGKNISSFKKELISMKKGDQVAIQGPFGWFKLQDNTTPIVMVAGGVGITPMRALLKELEKGTSRPVELVYAISEFALFEDELMSIAEKNEKIHVHMTSGTEETRRAVETLATQYKGEAYFYLSGSQNFIGSIKDQLVEKGIKGKRIINDPFYGY